MKSTKDIDKTILQHFFKEHWGSPQMVISSGIFQCDELDGYVMLDEGNRIVGLITYIMKDAECEIISIDSMIENKGIGTTLMNQVEQLAAENHCKLMKLVTTNDNMQALAFYQKRGFHLTKLLVNAVAKAREIKPEIPLVANNGIPIRDEIVLTKSL